MMEHPIGICLGGIVRKRSRMMIGQDKTTTKLRYELETEQGTVMLSVFPDQDDVPYAVGEVVFVGVRVSTFTNRRGFALYDLVRDDGKSQGPGEEF